MKTSFTFPFASLTNGVSPLSSPRVQTRHHSRRCRSLINILVLALGLASSSLTSAAAKEKKDLEITLTAQTVSRNAVGAEVLRNEVAVNPGDVVQYTALYHNTSTHALGQLAPTLPIPAGMEYLVGSASPAPTEASLDGKKFEPCPIRRSHKLPGGTELMVEIPASSYRALRWKSGDLAPDAAITLSVRTRIAASQ